MAPACQLCGSVEGRAQKRDNSSALFLSGRKLSSSSCLDVRHLSSSLYATSAFLFPFLKDFIYLFIFERGREGEREGEKHQCVRETSTSCLLHAPNWGLSLQPRHVP